MPHITSSQEWLKQSTLLFQAYPASSRIVTKYTIHPPQSANPKKRKRKAEGDAAPPDGQDTTSGASGSATADSSNPAAPTPPAPTATLTLKTYDPVSGVCLKYDTDKAAEVGRLIASLGRLGRHMAALPEPEKTGEAEKALVGDAVADAEVGARGDAEEPKLESTAAAPAEAKAGQAGGGGGGKKKKKGKK